MHTMLVWKNYTDIYELIYIINLIHLPSWTCRLEWNSVLGRIEYENSVRIDCLVNTRQDEQWLVRWPIALRNSISRPMCLSFLPEFPLALPTYTEVDVGDINFIQKRIWMKYFGDRSLQSRFHAVYAQGDQVLLLFPITFQRNCVLAESFWWNIYHHILHFQCINFI